MIVFSLTYGDDVLGIFSSELKSEEAKDFFINSEHFNENEYDFFSIQEFIIDEYTDEKYKIDEKIELKTENSKFKDFIQSMTIYSIGAIFLVIIVLGTKSCVNIVFGILNH
jgi:hypothetical protein